MAGDGLETFNDSYQFVHNGQPYEAGIGIFRNIDKATIDTSYEGGLTNTRVLDTDKDTYLNLDEGDHQVEMWNDLGYSTSHVTVKLIGNRKYLVFDSSFSPAGTVSRNYLIYSEKVGNLIEFSLTSYHDTQDTETSYKNDIYQVTAYSPSFQGFIDEIENAIAEI